MTVVLVMTSGPAATSVPGPVGSVTSKYFTPAGRNIQRDFTSFYDYYVADDSLGEEMPLKDREQFKTATGRTVYGGGGITPDFIVKPPQLARSR